MNKKQFLTKIIFFFIIPFVTHANYPYYNFAKLNIKLTPARYNRYVKPQIRNIIADYFHIMKKIEPAEQDLISIRNKVQKMNDIWKTWSLKCIRANNLNCQSLLQNLYKESRALDRVILSFQNQRLRIKNFGESKNLDPVLHLTSDIDTLSAKNYTVLHFVEESLMTGNTTFQAESLEKGKFTVLLQDMRISSELILPALISTDFRNVFDKVWYAFIKPLDRQILKDQDIRYLLRHLGDLNMAWNVFHMKVSKSELVMNKTELQTVQIMHNRWNSILKVLLRK